jgi:hypothetical protein
MSLNLVDGYLGMADPRSQVDGVSNHSVYSGGIVDQINDRNFVGLRRPYYDKNGRPAVTVNLGRTTLQRGEQKPIVEHVLIRNLDRYGLASPVANATTLRKEEWIQLDQQVLRAARYRLVAWADLAGANTFGGFNGMGKMILEHETMSDPGEAMVDMDGLTEGRTDAPSFQLQGLPLPITHADFWFSSRRLAISRNTGTPLDTTMGEAAGRRVAELIEKTTIGNTTGIIYGGNSTQVGGYGRVPQVYGYINFPNRITKTNLTQPTGTNAQNTLRDVLGILDNLRLNKFYGPFQVYHSNDWDQYMDNDYILTGGNVATQTLRARLRDIPGITDVKRLDFLFSSLTGPAGTSLSGVQLSTRGPGLEGLVSGSGGAGYTAGANPFTLIFVQMTQETARAVNGMDITTVQWESIGGMRLNFKVLCIQVPQLRADFYGNCGILHATIA